MKTVSIFLITMVVFFNTHAQISMQKINGKEKVFISEGLSLEYFALNEKDSTYYIVTSPSSGSYKDWIVYVGNIGFLEKRKAYLVRRLRDGGTTEIYMSNSQEELLYFPAPIRCENSWYIKNGDSVDLSLVSCYTKVEIMVTK